MSRGGWLYLLLSVAAAIATLAATVTVYVLWGREPPETLSAAIVNTAAVLAASALVGVTDMFFTMQERRERLAEKRQHDEERRQWRIREEEERKQREIREEEARQQREIREEEARQQREIREAEERQSREEERRQRAEHDARMEQLMTRFVEALERIERRNNGNGNGSGAA